MELWIPITIVGAFMQNLRSVLQKHLKGRLTTLGATYVRFFYAAPFAVLYVCGLNAFAGLPLPTPNPAFLMYCVLGGLAQILFTALLIYLFSFRNFAVGTTYSKTETVQVALLGFLILGDTLSLAAGLAILVSVIGVMALSVGQQQISVKRLFTGLVERPTLIGLLCGLFLGASVVFFRGGALALDSGEYIMSAAYTLAVSVVIQTIAMGAYLAWRERRTLTDIFVHWKWSLATGVAGVAASIAWFTAFTMQNAAYVRAVGQIELVFTFVASVMFFKERTRPAEVFGILLVVAGILILILGR